MRSSPIFAALIASVAAYNAATPRKVPRESPPQLPARTDRRAFLRVPSAAFAASSLLLLPDLASSADVSATVKVTPLAHTFVVSSGSGKVKPLRENDATRFLTNARVVHVFYGSPSPSAASDVLSLTVRRKAGEGPGVTPGSVRLLDDGSAAAATALAAAGGGATAVPSESADARSVAAAAASLPAGDVLFVPPAKSGGTAADGAVLAATAAAAGLEVGGAKSGGVIGILLNGPRDPDPLKVVEGAYEASTLLWYDI